MKRLFSTILVVIYVSAYVIASDCIPALPIPHANNAIADAKINGKLHLFSFTGLKTGKTWKDTSRKAYMYVEGDQNWTVLPDVPVKEGRLAASAQAVKMESLLVWRLYSC